MIVESLAATAVVFLLIVIVTQVAFAVVARDSAAAAVSAAARRAGRPGADLEVEQTRLADELSRVVAGATEVTALIQTDGSRVSVRAGIRWLPPGPNLVPITLRASSTAPMVVPP
ncbi:MAG: hypothetical protein ABFR89_05025 [Actinomycetota bacterium]